MCCPSNHILCNLLLTGVSSRHGDWCSLGGRLAQSLLDRQSSPHGSTQGFFGVRTHRHAIESPVEASHLALASPPRTCCPLARAPRGQSAASEATFSGLALSDNSVSLTMRAQAATTTNLEVAPRTSAWRTPEAPTEVPTRPPPALGAHMTRYMP